MNLTESDREQQVRLLAGAGLSTRHIARVVDVSQSTVVRMLQRINSGPQPVLREAARSFRLSVTAKSVRTACMITSTVMLTVIAAALATLAWG